MSYETTTTHRVGSVMVDSGQVMVGDPCYLDDFKVHGAFGTGLDLEPRHCTPPYEYSYQGASQATCSPEQYGEIEGGKACSVSSGYGDGAYPVYVEKNREGRVVALHVYFDQDPNEEDEDEDEDYCDGCGRSLDFCAGACEAEEEDED